jgi:hypothetical protein
MSARRAVALALALAGSAVGLSLVSVPAARAAEGPAECEPYGVSSTEDLTRLPLWILSNYRQTRLELVDPIGDFSLAAMAKATPEKIDWELFHKNAKRKAFDDAEAAALPCALALFGIPADPEAKPALVTDAPGELFEKPADLAQLERLPVAPAVRERLISDYHSGKLDLEGHRNTLPKKKILAMLVEVIGEEARAGLAPRIGELHRWSPEFVARYHKRFFPFSDMTKLLLALARGETDKYMITGAEGALEQWMLAQAYRSIGLADIFRQSYRLNAGDVYLSLMTVENLLAAHWRLPGRELLPTTLRLRFIVNHLGHDGNLFGAWYHFFGILLYGYERDGTMADVIGETERIGSHILNHFRDERQEDHVNLDGGPIGAALRKLLRKGLPKDAGLHPELAREDVYLDLGESYTRRLLKVARHLK